MRYRLVHTYPNGRAKRLPPVFEKGYAAAQAGRRLHEDGLVDSGQAQALSQRLARAPLGESVNSVCTCPRGATVAPGGGGIQHSSCCATGNSFHIEHVN